MLASTFQARSRSTAYDDPTNLTPRAHDRRISYRNLDPTPEDLVKPTFPLLFGLLVSLVSSALVADDGVPSQDPQDVFFDVTHVNTVNVEVFVTNKQGQPVNDLNAEDFEVYENGRLMEISNFYAVEEGRPRVPETVDTLAEPDLGDPRVGLPKVREDQRLHLIIYIDNFNIRPANRNRVINRLNRFLRENLESEDRVMVVSHDRSLHVRQPFTSDRSLVTSALLDIQELSGNAVNRDAERRSVLEDIEAAPDAFTAVQYARSFADSVFTEMEFTLRALERQVNALSGLVGRKAMLYVSDGIPLVVAEDVFIAVDENFERSNARLDAMAYSYSGRYREIIARANSGGVTFYTLDAGGLQVHQSISADYGGTLSGGSRVFIDSVRTANLQEPLHLVADDTGGRAITNTNAVEAGLGKMAQDFRNYYSIGYQAPHNGDGRYYKIDVKVKNKDYDVRHRNGYRDKTPEARLTDGSVAVLLFGGERNAIGAEVQFGNYRQDGKSFLLPVDIQIPLGKLTLAPRQDSYIGRVKIAVVVMDENGSLSPVQQQEPLSIQIPAAEIDIAREKHFSYAVTLAVRPGTLRLAVGVRDELAGEVSFLSTSARISG